MKPAPFEYFRPDSIKDALAALRENGDAMIIAGGQSLLPMLNLRVTAIEALIDISHLHDLKSVSDEGNTFSIGALATHASIEDGLGHDAFNGLLQRVASRIAYRAVRNMGTIGGSLCLSDPSADWPACMLALSATAVVASVDREYEIPLDEFLIDAYTTVLEPGELLLRINIPKRQKCAWGVSKVTRKSGAFADSLAIAVLKQGDQPARVTLSGTSSCARVLEETSALLDEQPDIAMDALSDAIRADVAAAHDDATAYQLRCHIHTVTSAIAEANACSKSN